MVVKYNMVHQTLFLFAVGAFFVSVAAGNNGDDLYAILGISNTQASIQEIKSAYRRKARDTHPDKRKDDNISAEEAALEFYQVVHAFEVLSDATSRKRYDTFGDDGSGSSNGNRRSSSFHQFFQRKPQDGMVFVNRASLQQVRQAQSRILHIVSLPQLRTIMLDDNDMLERHVLLCFYTPNIESLVMDNILFPFPFAGMSPQGIWWEDILQTASIRFRRGNDLTRYFNINGVNEDMTEPIFIFLKKGIYLGGDEDESSDDDDNEEEEESSSDDDEENGFMNRYRDEEGETFSVYATNDHGAFEKWMWTRIEVKVIFVNQHSHPVEMYWISGNRAHIKHTIQPQEEWVFYSFLTHEFYGRDARVDDWDGNAGRHKLTTNSSLGRWKIGIANDADDDEEQQHDDDSSNDSKQQQQTQIIREDGSVVITILPKQCLDLSGQCSFWAQPGQNQCKENPSFMHEKCAMTCGACGSKNNDARDEL